MVERAIKDKREGNTTNNSSIVRVINSESSIRNGKYGQYIYYKTAKMSKPSFIKLQGFSGNYLECPASELEIWIKNSRGDIPASAAEAKGTTSKRKPSASDRSSKKKWGK